MCRSGFCVSSDEDGSEESDDGTGTTDAPKGGDDDGTACNPNAVVVEGGLRTEVANVVFDRVTPTLFHKRDVDEFEDGCLNFIRFVFQAGAGCRLDVTARARLTPQARLSISEVQFSADSQCPNFPDPEEGVYRSSGGSLVFDASGVGGDLSIPRRNVERACFDSEFTLHLAGSLFDGSKELVINPTVLTVRGDFSSEAREESCPTF